MKGNDASGSFTGWGTGLGYRYDDTTRQLTIAQADGAPLIDIMLDDASAGGAADFIKVLEKSVQITALMLSNHTTHCLAEVMEAGRLSSILTETARIARHGLDLSAERFAPFEEAFCREYAMRKVSIRKVAGHESQSFYYFATLETRNGSRIEADGATLTLLLSALSGKVIYDLLATEIRYHNKSAPHILMALSYKLSLLSHILNRDFVPENHIRTKTRSTAQKMA